MNPLRRFRDVAISALLVAIPFFVLNSNLKNPDDTNAFDRTLLKLSGPIQYLATEAAGTASAIIQDYVYLVDVKAENDSLRAERARLRERLRELSDVALTNRRLRELLQLRQHLGGETVAAHIIGKEISTFFRVTRIRVDRGEKDRVKPGMPVIASGGLVGEIQRTEGPYSDVQLTVDQRSAIDVRIRRTGARGMLRGTGDSDRYLCQIQYLDNNDEVSEGDLVYTSGLGKRYPPSILVGKVSKVVRKEFGLHQEVEVVPSVNFANIEEVLVLTSHRNGPEDAP